MSKYTTAQAYAQIGKILELAEKIQKEKNDYQSKPCDDFEMPSDDEWGKFEENNEPVPLSIPARDNSIDELCKKIYSDEWAEEMIALTAINGFTLKNRFDQIKLLDFDKKMNNGTIYWQIFEGSPHLLNPYNLLTASALSLGVDEKSIFEAMMELK